MSELKWKSWRRRLIKFLLVGFVVIFSLFTIGLHVIGFLFSRHDRAMRSFPSKFLFNLDGRMIHYYELDQTNAEWNILFVHGTPAMAADFHKQFENPFPRANLIALDRPGFGRSGPGWHRPNLEEQAATALTVVPTNHLRTIIVGHSYGGSVALQMALKYPDRIAGVVLVGGAVDPSQEHIYPIQYVADWPILSWLAPSGLRECNRELITLRSDLLRMQPQIASLKVPVVMVHGSLDPLVPVANVAYLRNQLAEANKTNLFTSMVIPGYNHFIPWEHADAVESALQRLTARLQ